MKRRYLLLIPSLAALLAAACTQHSADAPPVLDGSKPTIAATIEDPAMTDLTTLADLLKSSGVDQTLKGPGPFTLFAPTNAAFAKMSPADLAKLKDPKNKANLIKILTYHACPKSYTAADLKSKVRIGTIEGDNLDVETSATGLKVGNDESPMANITKTDIPASNGTIHLIDAVFVPE